LACAAGASVLLLLRVQLLRSLHLFLLLLLPLLLL
jgi:hypothetical protein